MRSEINCKEVMSHICESLGEDFDSPKCSEIRAHLNECQGCRNYFKTVEMTINFYKRYKIEMPEDAHQRLLKYLGINEEE